MPGEQIGEAYVAIRAETGPDFQQSLSRVGGLLKGAFAAVATGGAIAAVEGLGATFDDLSDKIRVATGQTGASLAGLEDVAKGVATSIPASFDEAGTAVAGLNQTLGLTGTPLKDLSKQFIDLSHLTGGDLQGSITDITRLFGDWGVASADMGPAMDKVFRASQSTGIGVDQLSQQMVQFGAPLRQLGFSMEESAAMLGKWQKEGVNSELVLGGMKKALSTFAKEGEAAPETFRRLVDEIKNMKDPTEATGKAMEIFGSRAGPDMAAAIREGRFEYSDYLDAINNGSDTIAGVSRETDDWREKLKILGNKVLVGLEPIANRVFAAFGSVVEIAGQAVHAFMTGMSGDALTEGGGFLGFVAQAGVAVAGLADWFVSVWPTIKQVATDALAAITAGGQWLIDNVWPLLVAAFDGIAAAVKWFSDNTEYLIPVLIAAGAAIIATVVPGFILWAKEAWAAAAGTIAANAPLAAIVVAIAAVGAALIYAYEHWSWFREAVDAVKEWMVNTLWPALQRVWDGIKTGVSAMATAAVWVFENVLRPGFDGVKAFIKTASDVIGPILSGIGTFVELMAGVVQWEIDHIVKPAITGITAFVQEVSDAVDPILTGIGGFFETMADVASGAWDTAVSAIKAGWNAIAGLWNGSVGKIHIEIPSWIPEFGGKSFDMPDLPKLHSGGTIAGPRGAEVPIMAQAGEGVASIDTMARLDRFLARGGAGPLVEIDEAHFHNEVDVETFARHAGAILDYAGIGAS